MEEKLFCLNRATMWCLLETSAKKFGSLPALKMFGDEESVVSYEELLRRARLLAVRFMARGIESGDRVAILGESSVDWVITYFGIQLCGAVAVPILQNFSKHEVGTILEHSEAKGIVLDAKAREKVGEFKGFVLNFEDLSFRSQNLDRNAFERIAERKASEEAVASLIYTSGTTGQSKGVLLSNRNLVWNADACTRPFIRVKRGWRFLSILPLSHVYEFTVGLLLPLLCGATITYLGKAPTATLLMGALKSVSPHVMMSVPTIIEKVYRRNVLAQINSNARLKAFLANPLTRGFVYKAIGRKLRSSFGGSIKFLGVGGAALDLETEAFLDKAGFPYALGYGLTETSPMIAGCGPKDHKVGTLGKVVPGVSVRINPSDGEIQVKGPSVMVGYYHNEALTKETFTSDNWLRTGDLGLFKDGRLVINGRSKTMILGANGENIYPELIENVINNQEFVQESLILPDGGGLLALIRLDVDSLLKTTGENAQDYLKRLVSVVNAQLGSNSRIQGAIVQKEPFVRTPTQKIKRFLYRVVGRKAVCDNEEQLKKSM